ncbi:MAG: hypothetical protein ABI949_14655 [Ilumatobacteraceae bacterium]
MILQALESVDDSDRTSTAQIAARRFLADVPHDADLASRLEPLTERLERLDSFENSWALARAIWVIWIEARGNPEAVKEAGVWFEGLRIDRKEERLLHLANGIAWATRGDTWVPVDRLGLDEPADRFVLYVVLERRRFLFQYRALGAILDLYRSSIGRNPFLQAMNAFVLLQSDISKHDDGLASLTTAWNESRGTDMASPVADVCLHALWLSHRLKNQGAILLDFCDRGEREGRPSASMRRFRRATALRLDGRFGEAIQEIDEVLSTLSGSSEFTRTFTEQCLSQRDLAVEAARLERTKQSEVAELNLRLDKFRDDLADAEARAAESQQASVARSVEVVTFFTAAIGFAVGAVNIGGSAASPNDKLVVIAGLGLGLTSFATLIVLGLAFLSDYRTTSATLPVRRAVWKIVLVAAAVILASQAALVVWVSMR